jgi:hypothetical protein
MMKNAIIIAIVLFFAVLSTYPQAANRVQGGIATDGEYIGLQKMGNLTPENPSTEWFHENTLLIRNDEAILDMVPIWIRHGRKNYSASDGGFLTYRAKFIRKDEHPFVTVRLFQSDYAALVVPKDYVGKFDPYSEIKTYPVKFAARTIEINGVRYEPTKLDKSERERLLHALSSEPMEKTNTLR